MSEHLIKHLKKATPVLRDFIGDAQPACGIILGSGLNPFAETLRDARYLPYEDVPHMKTSTAAGHVGRFVLGTEPASGKTVLCMQGRLHKYEGNTPQQVAFPVWLMQRCGIDVLLTTNAAGAINPAYHVGDFCVMTDQINFTGQNPLVGVEPNQMAQRFVPMLGAFDAQLIEAARTVGIRESIAVDFGVYLGLLGPSFETPAEIRAFASWGADTVAMSVVEEVITARHMGMRVFGMSLITNMACGVENGDPQPDDIMQVAVDAESAFAKLMGGIIAAIGDEHRG